MIVDVRDYPTPSDALDALPAVGGTLIFPPTPMPYVLEPWAIDRPDITVRIPMGTVLRLDAGGAAYPLITVAASNVSITGRGTLDGAGDSIEQRSPGSGAYWSGLIDIDPDLSDVTIAGLTIRNTARGGIYAYGPSQRLTIERCCFADIGLPGAGNGGACVMLDSGICDSVVSHNRAYGRLSSNFLKVKGGAEGNSVGNEVAFNHLDYRDCTEFDDTYGALGIEMWTGAWYSRVVGNHVYGPMVKPTSGQFTGISFGDARGSVCSSNIIVGGDDLEAMQYGLEVADCPDMTLVGNSVSGAVYGVSVSNKDPEPSHALSISGGMIQRCQVAGLYVDSAPSALKVTGVSFIDCGQRFVFLNSNGGTLRGGAISTCSFQIKDQTLTDKDGHVYAIYAGSTSAKDVAGLTIADCQTGPYPGGTAPRGLVPLYVNAPQGVTMHHCTMDGSRPDTGKPDVATALNVAAGGFYADHNSIVGVTKNAVSFFPSEDVPLSVLESNQFGTLAIETNRHASYTVE